MKKISIEYILLYFEVVFAGIFILILLAYNISVKQDDFWDRGMYSGNVEGVQLSSMYLVSVKGEQVEFDVNKIDKSIKFALYKTLSEEYDEIVRGIYQTKDLFNMEDYISTGRFFKEDDFDSSNPVAVIGTDMMDHTIEQNGKTYFGYEKQLFEVVGVFRKTGKALDHVAYLNLNCLLNKGEDFGLYYIDSNSKETVDQVVDDILSQADGRYTANRVEYEGTTEENGLNFMNNTLLVCAVSAVLLNLVITIVFFVEHKRYRVAVQKLCGMTKWNIFTAYGRKLLFCFCAAVFSIEIILYFGRKRMGFFFTLESLSWQHHLMMVCTVSVIYVITVIGMLRLTGNIDISSSLKNR
ncbi:ABC transporter permease [Agathobacter sp.]